MRLQSRPHNYLLVTGGHCESGRWSDADHMLDGFYSRIKPNAAVLRTPMLPARSLTMAVQPTATAAANTRTTNGEQDSMMPSLSPYTVELNRVLLEHHVKAWMRLCEQERRFSRWHSRHHRHQRHRRHLPLQYDLRPDQPVSIQLCKAFLQFILWRVLLEALSEPPAGETTLSNATTAIKAGHVTSTSASTQTASMTAVASSAEGSASRSFRRIVNKGKSKVFRMHGRLIAPARMVALGMRLRLPPWIVSATEGNRIGGIDWDAFVNDDGLA